MQNSGNATGEFNKIWGWLKIVCRALNVSYTKMSGWQYTKNSVKLRYRMKGDTKDGNSG